MTESPSGHSPRAAAPPLGEAVESPAAILLGDERQARVGRLLILAAALFWSSNGFFVKSPVFADWPLETRGVTLAFWRAVFASLCLIPAIRRPRWNARLVPMALGFAAMNLTFLTSMTLTTAANAIWLQSTAPIWIFCSSLWIYREPWDPRNRIPLATGLLGAALIVVCESIYVPTVTSFSGVLYGIVSGICYGVVVVSMRRLRDENAAWLIAVNHATAVVLLGPYVLTHGPWPEGGQWLALAAFGGLQMGLPYFLFAQALKRISSQEGAAIGLLEPVLVPVWVWLAWSEMPAWWTIAGGVLILIGLSYRYLEPLRRRSATPERLA